MPAYAASRPATSTTTQGYYYHTVRSQTPSGCNPTTNPQTGYIDNLPYRSPAGNSNANRDPNSSNGYWVEGSAGTVTNISITTTYTFNYDIVLTNSGQFGSNVLMPGWTVTQTSARVITATYTGTSWNVSTSVSGSGDATGFFINFKVASVCLTTNGALTVTTNTTMNYTDANGRKTYTKRTGPTGI